MVRTRATYPALYLEAEVPDGEDAAPGRSEGCRCRHNAQADVGVGGGEAGGGNGAQVLELGTVQKWTKPPSLSMKKEGVSASSYGEGGLGKNMASVLDFNSALGCTFVHMSLNSRNPPLPTPRATKNRGLLTF